MVGLLTFFLGLLLGNWLAIGRDKRKEFNAAVAPIREWLLKQNETITDASPPSNLELDTLMSCLGWWRRRKFWKAYTEQSAARSRSVSRDLYGTPTFSEEDAIANQIRKCLVYARRR